MAGTFVAKSPPRVRSRLNLAPRQHEDESLSSWLERLGGCYGLTMGELLRWLGYRAAFSYGQALIDLDVHPPRDLSGILEQHTGVPARSFDEQRLSTEGVLPIGLRRSFCPRCWVEDGPYRRREWASAWSLVCTRHRRPLREKPAIELPAARHAEDSWLAFYDTPRLWRGELNAWEEPIWIQICHALGVNPQIEFLRAYRWLRELQAGGAGVGGGVRMEDWPVRRDLAMYGVLKFRRPAILQILDPGIEASRLIQTGHRPEVCGIVTPEADYHVRLFAATVAWHVWELITRGDWRCAARAKLADALGDRNRWNDEDWWLERRLYMWPEDLKLAGRRVFRKEAGGTLLPPWAPCRDYCTHHLPRGARGVIVPREGWRCRWTASGEIHDANR